MYDVSPPFGGGFLVPAFCVSATGRGASPPKHSEARRRHGAESMIKSARARAGASGGASAGSRNRVLIDFKARAQRT